MVPENVADCIREVKKVEKKNIIRTPIALFTYNRSDHTQKVLDSLAQCRRLDECDLFVYCDGPRNPEQTEKVTASRRVVQSYAEKNPATVIIRENNMGLSRSIVSGVTELCQRYGRVIVLEDDFILSPLFIDYMLQALDRYKDAENVYQVSGYMFPVEFPDKPDCFFLPFTTTWGWATWDRAWKIFDWNATGHNALFADKRNIARFNLDNSYPYYEMLQKRFSGKNDSWGILWWYAVYQAGGFVLHPKKSLVWVGGFDGSGTHCGKQNEKQIHSNDLWSLQEGQQIDFPESVMCDNEIYKRIIHYNKSQKKITIITKIWRLMRNRISECIFIKNSNI